MNKLNYIKKLLKVLIYPILFFISEFIIRYIFVSIFNFKEKGNLTNNEFLQYIKTIEYKNNLDNYLNNKLILILFISSIIFIPIFYKVIKKYIKKSKVNVNGIFVSIILGITISIIYNISLFNLNKNINITNQFELSKIPIIIQIISSGIIGPIIEEMLFRGIVYNKLKEFNKPMSAIILTSIIFSIFHTNVFNVIYAFGVSFLFIYLYEKYKTLRMPIIMHMALNITIIVLLPFIVKNDLAINLLLVFISIITLLILKFKFFKKN